MLYGVGVDVTTIEKANLVLLLLMCLLLQSDFISPLGLLVIYTWYHFLSLSLSLSLSSSPVLSCCLDLRQSCEEFEMDVFLI